MLNDSARALALSAQPTRSVKLQKHALMAFPLVLAAALFPEAANACACGCAVFDVGTSSLLPSGPGGTVFLEYDFLDQNQNWSGTSRAPSADNDDKEIRTNFFVAGGQYMFNSSWGVMAEIPFTDRTFRTEDPDDPGTFEHAALGDIRLMGVLFGFLARHVDRDYLRREVADRQLDLPEFRFRYGDRQRQHGHFVGRLSHRIAHAGRVLRILRAGSLAARNRHTAFLQPWSGAQWRSRRLI